MADFKESQISANEIPLDGENGSLSEEKKGTPDDQKDMLRMGKAQEMRVGKTPHN